jgi:hypothetical protein
VPPSSWSDLYKSGQVLAEAFMESNSFVHRRIHINSADACPPIGNSTIHVLVHTQLAFKLSLIIPRCFGFISRPASSNSICLYCCSRFIRFSSNASKLTLAAFNNDSRSTGWCIFVLRETFQGKRWQMHNVDKILDPENQSE